MSAATMELMMGETRPMRVLSLLVAAAAIVCLLLPYIQAFMAPIEKPTAAAAAPASVTSSASRVADADARQGIRAASAAGL